MKKEIEVILLGCLVIRTVEEENRLSEILPQKLDWAWITGQLVRHRLNGNFYTGLNDNQLGYIVSKVRATFEFLTECYNAVNEENMKLIQKVFDETNKEGIMVAGLKGLFYNTTIYSLNTRKSNDMDLLVEEMDIPVFEKIMERLGFIQSFDRGFTKASKKDKLIQRMNYHDLVPFYKRLELPFLDAVKIDVNFQFDSKDHEITRDILNEGIQVYEKNGYKVNGLIWQTNLLFLCVHFYREASNSIWTSRARDVDLYKVVDIENTIRNYSTDELIKWLDYVHKYSLEKQCFYTLFQLNKFYPNERYEVIMNMIKPKDNTFLNQIYMVGKGTLEERSKDFFDQAFDMNYGVDFDQRDFSRVF